MRLLLISNPEAYRTATTDIPLSYARLASSPGIELFHADTGALLTPGDSIAATRVPATFQPEDFVGLGEATVNEFAPGDFDLGFCRTLKPFPPDYLHRLQDRSAKLRFVNDPAGIERQLELGFVVEAAGDFMPPTLITADAAEAESYFDWHGTLVAKRANSCGGRGVFKLSRDGSGDTIVDHVVEGELRFGQFSEAFQALSAGEPLLLTRYLRRVTEGEKRIIVLDGAILGAYQRTSANGHWIQNVSFGAKTELTSVSEREAEIVANTCGRYRDRGIHLLGYDLLRDDAGEWVVSEINAGNIGGVFRLETMGVPGVTRHVVEWLEQFAARPSS